MPRSITGKRIEPNSIERELKRKLKGSVTTKIRANYQDGALLLTGDVASQDALQQVDEIIAELLPTADVDNRIRIRARSEAADLINHDQEVA